MKKNIHRILGVALSLVLVFSLAAAFMPANKAVADPAENEWSEFKVPKSGKASNWVLCSAVPTVDIGPIARAVDGTLYAYVGPTGSIYDGTTRTLFKSDDDGVTWAYSGKTTNTHPIVAIATSPTDADVLYYATNTDDDGTSGVYKSENAGGKFEEMLDITAAINWAGTVTNETITSLDCALIGDDHVIIVGTKGTDAGDTSYGHIYVFDEGVRITPAWEDQTVGDYDVWAVAASPDFEDSKQIIAVVTGLNGTGEHRTYIFTKSGASGWNSTIAAAPLRPSDDDDLWVSATRAAIAFPSDYDSDVDEGYTTLFVGVSDNASAPNDGGDVYEFIAIKAAEGPSVCLDKGASENITDLVVDGAASSCTIIAGTDQAQYNLDEAIMRNLDGGEPGLWKSSKKEPTGNAGEVYLAIDADFADTGKVWAAVGGLEGGVSLRVEDRLYNQVGLINTTIYQIEDLSPVTDEVLFMATGNYTTATSVAWATSSVWVSGESWQRCFSSTLQGAEGNKIDLVEASPDYETDTTVFLSNLESTDKLYRSTDGGQYFKQEVNAPVGITIKGWVVIDDSTVIVGGAGGIRKTTTNGKSWKPEETLSTAGDVENFALSPNFAEDETILVGGEDGEVWRSTDAGETWAELKYGIEDLGNGSVWPGFHADFAVEDASGEGHMYAAAELGGVWRYIKGHSTKDNSTYWSRMELKSGCSDNDTGYAVNTASGLVTAPNVLYAVDSSAAGEGVSRSVNPTGSLTVSPYVFFDDLFETPEGDLPQPISKLWATPGSNTMLWTLYDSPANEIWALDDILVKKVPLSSPEDGTDTGRIDQVELNWEKLEGAVYYQVYVNTRSDFKGTAVLTTEATVEGTTTISTSATTKGLDQIVEIAERYTGIPLYWRVRVYECNPFRSLFSDTWSFTTELKGAEWNPFRTAEGFAGNVAPLPGATGVPLKPTFQWNGADWATGYEFVLATDGDFTKVLKSLKTTNPVWACDIELLYSGVYFWKVRAVSDTSQSEWGVGTFVCMDEPVAPPKPPVAPAPAPPVILPPAPAPIAPSYIWAIIGIGAVLVIAVIVLIVRTRRVA